MGIEQLTTTNVGGIDTACVTRRNLIEIIVASITAYKSGRKIDPCIVFDSNGHGISLANTSKKFNKALELADIVHADGQSVVMMSNWVRGSSIPERSGTTDTIHDIATMQDDTLSHFLLGGHESIAKECAEILTKKYDNFTVVGTHHGYFSGPENQTVIDQINVSKPDVLWVGLGKPREQYWVLSNRHRLHVPVIVTCGGCYNYVTGDYKRAPQSMQEAGFEWLHRMLTQPRNLFWRYFTTNPHSIYCVLKHKYFGA